MIQQRQRSRSHRQQRLILALGCGSSVVLHLGLIAGISYWWRSPAPVDEPIDITLVEPTEIEPVIVSPSPPLAQPPKINITNPPAQVAQPKPTVLKSVSKPIVVTPAPQSVAVVVKPISKPIRTVAKPSPGSSSTQTKAKPNPRPIQTAKINLPINAKPIVNPFPTEPKTSTPKPVQTPLIDNSIATKPKQKPVQRKPKTTPNLVNPPFTFPTPQPLRTTAVPTPIPSEIAANSPPVTVKPNSQAAAIPKNPPATSPDAPITPTTTSDLSSPMSPKSPARSTTSIQLPTGGNLPNNDDRSIPSRDRSPGGGLTENGSRSGSPQAGSSVPDGDSSFRTERTGGNGGSGNGNGSSGNGSSGNGNGSGSGSGGLQCIQHCEIPKLRDLQDRDGGKDRLRIRIVVDPNGLVLAATISKSSDNPQIDAVVLEGIKRMQFKPSGKTIKGIIKANIIL